MFTIQQIKDAHAKVKSGADFPAYIREMKALGVTSYQLFVADGHTEYHGAGGYDLSSETLWPVKAIAAPASAQKLAHDLKIHQLGKTDFLTFCQQSADAGVEKWTVDMEHMTCTYYDAEGKEILAEAIPTTA